MIHLICPHSEAPLRLCTLGKKPHFPWRSARSGWAYWISLGISYNIKTHRSVEGPVLWTMFRTSYKAQLILIGLYMKENLLREKSERTQGFWEHQPMWFHQDFKVYQVVNWAFNIPWVAKILWRFSCLMILFYHLKLRTLFSKWANHRYWTRSCNNQVGVSSIQIMIH